MLLCSIQPFLSHCNMKSTPLLHLQAATIGPLPLTPFDAALLGGVNNIGVSILC